MEENNGIKIANVINLPALNLKNQVTINMDSSTQIKQILNIETCLLDYQIEPMLNKALIKGNIGIKVVYVDTDNIYGSVSDTVAFSETLSSNNISIGSEINICNAQWIVEYEHDAQSVKILIEGTIDCLCNINAELNVLNQTSDSLITKKSVLQAYNHVQKINKTTNFDFNFKLGSKIGKILSYDSKISLDEIKCYDGYVLLVGQIFNTLLYEDDRNDSGSIKIVNNSTPFKCEVEASCSDADCCVDASAYINLNSTQITTDIYDNDTQLNFEYCIVLNGNIYKVINMDVVDDVYSLEGDVDVLNSSCSICKKMPFFKVSETIDAEITLSDELNVDEILGMINTSATITQRSVKDNLILVEGVINGNLIYLDENKEVKHLPTQLPYSINIKQEFPSEVCAINLIVIPTNCKCKIKRGNILMIDYEVCVSGSAYTKNEVQLINGVKYGKAFNFDDIAFQIYVAHANESCWDLCKRLHITQEKLIEYNKENPTTYNGGEKIIVYR